MTTPTTITPIRCPGWADDGNAFAIMGKVQRCLKRAGRDDDAKAYIAEATSGDYDHLVQTTIAYVEFDEVDDEDDMWDSGDVEIDEPECPVCGDGGRVDDPGPNDGCAEFASVAYCLCPAGPVARREDEERGR